jgi:hypothetical protein
MPLKIGLLVGREATFPPAFLDEVRRRDAGVMAEHVKLGGTRMDEPCPYSVLIDRISHEVPYYRSYLKNAVLQGATVVNNPFMWTADDKFFEASLATKLGIAHPRTLRPTQPQLRPRHRPDREPAQPHLPARLGRDRQLRRPAVRTQGRARRRLEERVDLPFARGIDPAV